MRTAPDRGSAADSRRLGLAPLLVLFVLFAPAACAAERPLPAAAPETLGISAARLGRIDGVGREALERGDLPGAVVLIAHRGHVVLRKAYGARSLEPDNTLMGPDTVFDLASLTKPIATATAIMLLLEEGKLRLEDPVAQYLPPFTGDSRDKITIEQLLLHVSGLIADNPVADYADGRQKALERICRLKPIAEPGSRFIYSDVNYILLGEIVERLSGMPLDQFTRQRIFQPLGMNETGFKPQGALKARAAPTERRDGRWMVGEVHDPRAYLLRGVAGHAGLFSTADDVAVFAQMILNGGAYHGRRILAPATVRLMTTPRPVPGGKAPGLRAYGWDVSTAYSRNRGELFPVGKSFGHTGFTGTSIWIDPTSESAVIILSNRVHPAGKGNVTRLRSQVATLAAAALLPPKRQPLHPVAAGIDVLVHEHFARLKGRRVGLVTNHSGLDREGRPTIDLLHQAPGVTLVALFSPEHGIRGAVDAKVADSRDDKTGLPIYSLYGKRLKPTADTLEGIDTLVYDIQDAGCRFYTYISTLGYVLEAAAAHKLKVIVLDRPNPIGGLAVEGPVLDPGRESFVAYHALPVRHGLTVGELALFFNRERKLGADLEVVRLEGWKRGDLYDRTGLSWVNPSPNLRSLTEALLYPGIGLLETTNLSVGRGTDRPFEWIGAPWLDGQRLAAALATEDIAGVRFVPLRLTPVSSVHKGKACGGVQIIVDDWARFQPVRTGLAIASVLRRLYPQEWQVERFNALLGHRETWEGVRAGRSWQELEQAWQPELNRFIELRRSYMLYDE
jgi:uncharacterized protein YbbC (DUF1343 family)/CubicO group peptidase (beta-lactamase class C family)